MFLKKNTFFAASSPLSKVLRWGLYFFTALGLNVGQIGCSDNTVVNFSSLHAPQSVASAGGKLFVMNSLEAAVQVYDISHGTDKVEPIYGPGQLLPLRIPVGDGEVSLRTVGDGLWIAVLNHTTGTLLLIDVKTLLLVRDAAGSAKLWQVSTGNLSADTVAAMETASCASPCLAKIYINLVAGQAVIALSLEQFPGGLALTESGRRMTGVRSSHMAVSADGDWLFVNDVDGNQLIRIDLTRGLSAGAVDSVSLGNSHGGVIAVSPDGKLVMVGRPQSKDLLVLKNESSLTVVSADAVRVPWPQCIAACDSVSAGTVTDNGGCVGAHPADIAVCIAHDADGNDHLLKSSDFGGNTYSGLWLNTPISHILAMDIASVKALTVQCGNVASATQEFLDYAMVSGSDGRMVLVGVRHIDGTVAPQVIDLEQCHAPSICLPGESRNSAGDCQLLTEALHDACGENNPTGVCPAHQQCTSSVDQLPGCTPALPLSGIFEPCIGLDVGARAVCVAEHMVVFPGTTGARQLVMEWEGLSDPALDRSAGGGEIDSNGNFFDARSSLANTSICSTNNSCGITERTGTSYAGDILEILSAPLNIDGCVPCDPTNGFGCCQYERRIIGREGGTLLLNKPLDSACFRTGGAIAYKVRAGDQFVATMLPRGVLLETAPIIDRTRLSLGDIMGPNDAVNGVANATWMGYNKPVIAQVSKNLSPHITRTSCERYESTGISSRQMIDEPMLQRFASMTDAPIFDIKVPYQEAVTGTLVLSGDLAAIPMRGIGGMILADFSNGDTTHKDNLRVVLTSTIHNQLVAVSPFDANAISLIAIP